jgi:hypothetical protein
MNSMSGTSPSDERIASQIETCEPQQRVVLLGASNLSIMFPTIVESLRAMFAHPIELHVAKGFGRSYGLHSKFFGKKFPGILSSGLWPALNRARPLPTVAIVADVGNDLAYEAPVDKIVEWVERALDRLAIYDARVALNNLPIESLRGVGKARYYALREALFPNCKLSHREILERAERLSGRLAEIAETREISAFSAEKKWYGLDPIHPRIASAGEIWSRMLGAIGGRNERAALVRPSAAAMLKYRRLRPLECAYFGVVRRAAQPAWEGADGTRISIY